MRDYDAMRKQLETGLRSIETKIKNNPNAAQIIAANQKSGGSAVRQNATVTQVEPWRFKKDGTKKTFDELTTPEVLTWISTLEPSKQQSAATQFETEYLKNPASNRYDPYYTQYSNNDAARQLFGVNTFDQNWIDANRGYANYLTFSGENYTSPKKPGKTASAQEQAAYQWWLIANTYEQTTQAAEQEYAQLRSDLQDRISLTGGRMSADEVIAGIDWSQYKTLSNLRETSAAGNARMLNRPVQVGDASIRSMVNAALRGEDITEAKDWVMDESQYLRNAPTSVEEAMREGTRKWAQGTGKQTDFATIADDRANVTSLNYDPYYGNASNNKAAQELFGEQVFDQAWIDANRDLLAYVRFKDEDDKTPIKPDEKASDIEKRAYQYWLIANTYEQTTSEGEKELAELEDAMRKRAKYLGDEATAAQLVSDIDWEKYPTLVNMRETAAAGNARMLNRPVRAGDESILEMAKEITGEAEAERIEDAWAWMDEEETEQTAQRGRLYTHDSGESAAKPTESPKTSTTDKLTTLTTAQIDSLIRMAQVLPEGEKKQAVEEKISELRGMMQAVSPENAAKANQMAGLGVALGSSLSAGQRQALGLPEQKDQYPTREDAQQALAAAQEREAGRAAADARTGKTVQATTERVFGAAEERQAPEYNEVVGSIRYQYGITGAMNYVKSQIGALDIERQMGDGSEESGLKVAEATWMMRQMMDQLELLEEEKREREEIAAQVREKADEQGWSGKKPGEELIGVLQWHWNNTWQDALRDAENVPIEDYEKYLIYRAQPPQTNYSGEEVFAYPEMAKYDQMGDWEARAGLAVTGVAEGVQKSGNWWFGALEEIEYGLKKLDPRYEGWTREEIYAVDRDLADLRALNSKFEGGVISDELRGELQEKYPVMSTVSMAISESIKMGSQGAFGGAVGEILRGVPTVGKLLGKAGEFLPFAMDAFTGGVQTARSEGATDEQALLAGSLNAVISGPLSGAAAKGLEKVGGTVLAPLFNKALNTPTGQRALASGAAKIVEKGWGHAVLSLLRGAAGEGIEEALEEPIQSGISKAVYDRDRAWFGEGGVIDPAAMLESGMAGAAVGLAYPIFGAVGGIDFSGRQAQAQHVQELISNAQALTVGISGEYGEATQTMALQICERLANGEIIAQSEYEQLWDIIAEEAAVQEAEEAIVSQSEGVITSGREEAQRAQETAQSAAQKLTEAQATTQAAVQEARPLINALNDGTANYADGETAKKLAEAHTKATNAKEAERQAAQEAETAQRAADEAQQRADETENQIRAQARAQAQGQVEAEVQTVRQEAAAQAEEVRKAQYVRPAGKPKAGVQRKYTRTIDARAQTQLNILDSLGKSYGVEFDVVDTLGEGVNAMYSPGNPGVIMVSLDASEGAYIQAGAHELVHYVRSQSAEGYTLLRETVLDAMKRNDMADDELRYMVDQRIKQYQEVTGQEMDENAAMEEIIAEAVPTIFTDPEALDHMIRKDRTVVEKIRDFFRDFAAKLRDIAERYMQGEDRTEMGYLLNDADAMMEIAYALDDALEMAGRTEREPVVEGISVSTNRAIAYNSDPETLYSLRTLPKTDYITDRDKVAEQLKKKVGVSLQDAQRYIDNLTSIAAIIANDPDVLDFEAEEEYSPVKPNSDYKWTIDFSTLCKKRLLYTGTFDAIQRAIPNTALTENDYIRLRNMMVEKRYEVACAFCYVESRRKNNGEIIQQFLDVYRQAQEGDGVMTLGPSNRRKQFKTDPNFNPTIASFNTSEGFTDVLRNHKDVYNAYMYFMNARGVSKPKLIENRTDYEQQILSKFKSPNAVRAMNRRGGLRLQSFSDFEVVNLLDMMQVITDMSRVRLTSQAYTKVPEFARVFGGTGVKINLSLVTKGLDSEGNLVFDDVEGMPHEEAFEIREMYGENVGTVLVGRDDATIRAAMADPRIDYIIPYHASGWSNENQAALGIAGYTNYTSGQREIDNKTKKGAKKAIYPSEYWDFSKSGDENAQKYLELCKERGLTPKFPQFAGESGYWKLLIDFRMYDNDGKGAPQRAVKPDVNMDEARKVLNEYKGGHASLPVAQDVVEEFLAEKRGVKFSVSGGGKQKKSPEATIAGRILRKYRSDADRGEVVQAIDRMRQAYEMERAAKTEQEHDKAKAAKGQALDIIGEIANKIALSGSRKVEGEVDEAREAMREQYSDLRKRLRNEGISLTEMQQREVASSHGSYGDWRRGMMGMVRIKEGSTTLKALWSELSAQYPELFPADTNEGDMPAVLEKFVDQVRPSKPTFEGLDVATAGAAIALEIESAVLAEIGKEAESVSADMAARELREKGQRRAELTREANRAKRLEAAKAIAGQIRAAREAGDDNALREALNKYRDEIGRNLKAAGDLGVIEIGLQIRDTQATLQRLNQMISQEADAINDADYDADKESAQERMDSLMRLKETIEPQVAALHRQQILMRAKGRIKATDAMLDESEQTLRDAVEEAANQDMKDAIAEMVESMRGRVERLAKHMKAKMPDYSRISTISLEDCAAAFSDLEAELARNTELAQAWQDEADKLTGALSDARDRLTEYQEQLNAAKHTQSPETVGELYEIIGVTQDQIDVLKSRIREAQSQAQYYRRSGASSMQQALREGRFAQPIMERVIAMCADAARENNWFNRSVPIQGITEASRLKFTTAARVWDDLFVNAAPLARALYYDPVMDNETDRQVWIKEWRERIAALKLTPDESYLVQLIGENKATKDIIDGASDKVLEAVELFRVFYDEAWQMANKALVRNGYPGLGKIHRYFPHISKPDTIWEKLGIPIDEGSLPTSINGLTEMFSPGKQYSPHAQERTGDETDFDALFGFEEYIGSMSNIIFHTDDIQRLRQLESEIRAAAANGVFTGGKGSTHLSEFVKWIHEYTNLLAGKKSSLDRGAEDTTGRVIYRAIMGTKAMKGASAVAGNLASAVTNMVPVQQVLAEHPQAAYAAIAQVMFRQTAGKGNMPSSQYLMRRFGSDVVNPSAYERVMNKASKPFNWVDALASNIVVNTYYQANLDMGMDSETAMRSADAKAARLMGDRSKGAMPTAYHSQIVGLFTQFKYEIANQSQHFRKDILRGKSGTDAFWVFFRTIITGYIWNQINEWLTGRRSAVDPIQMGIDMYEAWQKEGEILPMAQVMFNNVSEMFPVPGGGGRIAAFDGFLTAIQAMMTEGNTIEDIKYGASVLGWSLTPAGGQLKKVKQGVQALIQGGVFNASGKELKYPVGGENWGDYILAPLFGRSSTAGGKAYSRGDAKALSESGTTAYQQYRERGATTTEAYRNEADKAAASSLETQASKAESAQADAEARRRAGLEAKDVDTSQVESQRDEAKGLRSEAVPGDLLSDYWWQRKDEPSVQAGIWIWRKTGKEWALPKHYAADEVIKFKDADGNERKEAYGQAIAEEANRMYAEGYEEIMRGAKPERMDEEMLEELKKQLEKLKEDVNKAAKERIKTERGL